MATFKPNSDISVQAAEPKLDVVATATNPLKVGKHVFRLVVRDDAGNDSDPALVTIIVVDTERPTAVVDVMLATGERSADIGGKVALWQWELLQP